VPQARCFQDVEQVGFEMAEHFIRVFQPPVREAADHVEQAERLLPVRAAGRADHAVVEQGPEALGRVEAIPPADGLGGLLRERGREDRQQGEQLPGRFRQQVVAPLQCRGHRLLAAGQVGKDPGALHVLVEPLLTTAHVRERGSSCLNPEPRRTALASAK
jgi:hypothetical protein